MKKLLNTSLIMCIILMLISCGEKGPTPKNNQALIEAVGFNKIGKVKKLIKRGADVNYIGRFGSYKCTPLIEASSNGNDEIVKLLLDNVANPNKKVEENFTYSIPLIESVIQDNYSTVQLLLNNGADVHEGGEYALERAIDQSKNIDVVKLLVNAGANINAIGSRLEGTAMWSFTALILSIRSSTAEIVEFLINSGANVNRADFNAKTPLMYAIEREDVDIIRLLIKKGANVNSRPDHCHKYKALDFACETENQEIIEMLYMAGAQANVYILKW